MGRLSTPGPWCPAPPYACAMGGCAWPWGGWRGWGRGQGRRLSLLTCPEEERREEPASGEAEQGARPRGRQVLGAGPPGAAVQPSLGSAAVVMLHRVLLASRSRRPAPGPAEAPLPPSAPRSRVPEPPAHPPRPG